MVARRLNPLTLRSPHQWKTGGGGKGQVNSGVKERNGHVYCQYMYISLHQNAMNLFGESYSFILHGIIKISSEMLVLGECKLYVQAVIC